MPPRLVPPNDKLLRMYYSGLSTPEIAEQLGLNPVTVNSALHRAGCRFRGPSEAQRMSFKKGRHRPTRYWLGKKQPRLMVEKRVAKTRGDKHYLWRGGNSRRGYRLMIRKEKCSTCGTRRKLVIHHVNFDHYDNRLSNLRVLCSSCHQSFHKKAYWERRRGKGGMVSNAPIGWIRSSKGGDR